MMVIVDARNPTNCEISELDPGDFFEYNGGVFIHFGRGPDGAYKAFCIDDGAPEPITTFDCMEPVSLLAAADFRLRLEILR